MTLPLYKAATELPLTRQPPGNAGLWFDKFCNDWDSKEWTMANRKLQWIKSFTSGTVGSAAQIQESSLRLAGLVESRGGRWAVFTTESRFVTGLGRSHPVENGFAWHPTLGTPYLPGSSVKGMIRAWAKLDANSAPESEAIGRLLGDPDKAGSICLLEAIPIKPVQLEADVMTPHYAGWSKEKPPGDWRSPIPIPFLATAANTPFLFGIIPRYRSTSDAPLDRRERLAVLSSGLVRSRRKDRSRLWSLRNRRWQHE